MRGFGKDFVPKARQVIRSAASNLLATVRPALTLKLPSTAKCTARYRVFLFGALAELMLNECSRLRLRGSMTGSDGATIRKRNVERLLQKH
jgi:hypothetical protein